MSRTEAVPIDMCRDMEQAQLTGCVITCGDSPWELHVFISVIYNKGLEMIPFQMLVRRAKVRPALSTADAEALARIYLYLVWPSWCTSRFSFSSNELHCLCKLKFTQVSQSAWHFSSFTAKQGCTVLLINSSKRKQRNPPPPPPRLIHLFRRMLQLFFAMKLQFPWLSLDTRVSR